MTKSIDLRKEQEFDSRRHVARLLHDSEKSRAVLFCLEPGQELAPHESTSEVLFCGVEGSPTVLVGSDRVSLPEKSLVVCPPGISHGIQAGAKRAAVLAVITPRPA